MNVLVVDDEQLARERLKRLLEQMPEFQLAGEAATGAEAMAQIAVAQPDVVLLDVRMPGMDGLEAARRMAELPNPPAVIFCTAYDDYALEAFDAQAVGYLLKPVKAEALEAALRKAGRLNKLQLAALGAPEETREARTHISTRTHRGVELVPVEDVRCFMADHKYVTAYHSDGEVLIDDTLKELEDEFAGRFLRIHRNALVAIEHIEGLDRHPEGYYQVRLRGTDNKPVVSRRHVARVRKFIQRL